MTLRQLIPSRLKRLARPLRGILQGDITRRRANITEPTGVIRPGEGSATLVAAVSYRFNQDRPDAMMTCRMGLCRAFEQMGFPYLLAEVRDLTGILPEIDNPFICIFGADYDVMDWETVNLLKRYPLFVWVNPWFEDSDLFFAEHGLDSALWDWPAEHRRKILESEPDFVYTATVESGLNFFSEWARHGLKILSLPLACDTSLYNLSAPFRPEFSGIKMAFVGGYWPSKGRQMDTYLRPFEDDLVIYGYNQWPYRGYRGQLSREAEPSLYREARVSPSINEPSVQLLRGQINERIFKVLGSGGVTVVDAVPAYRELFTEDELPIPRDEHEFEDMARQIIADDTLRRRLAQKGCEAVINRHTYRHRAAQILPELNLEEIVTYEKV
ncbi:MAG: glycosyltransferase [Sedimentisphaerales bacterium]|nr:glycosyltransferase [Sedimentisphaerales bacterium]